MNSYAKPAPSLVRHLQGTPLKPLQPLQPPPQLRRPSHPLPALPTPLRARGALPNFTLSTHFVPAAFPRSTAPGIPSAPAPADESKDARKARTRREAEELHVRFERHYHSERRDGDHGDEEVLWNAVNRFVRDDVAGADAGLTLYCAHANGLVKETFEPTLRELVRRAEAEAGYRIDEIWLLEAVNQGDSALVNGSRLPTLFDWKDHTRDHLNFFLNYLPETVSAQPLPTLLERVPDAVADARRVRGFPQRKLVAIGHSLGGSTLALAAYYYPALFAGLVLVDPVIAPVGHETHALKIGYASGALSRRETWPSREEAHKLLRASPFFGAWEPEVLKLYVEHGLTPDGSGVRLKTTGFQEAATFADTLTRQEAWTAVGQIDERIPLKWLCAETAAKGVLGDEEIERQRVWLRPENASNARVPGAGHLIVQERPRELGQAVHAFLVEKFGMRKALL